MQKVENIGTATMHKSGEKIHMRWIQDRDLVHKRNRVPNMTLCSSFYNVRIRLDQLSYIQ